MSNEPQPAPAPSAKRKRFNIELFSAGVAILLSLLSIVVAYRSELTQREMLAASIWPHVQFGHGNVDGDGVQRIAFELRNVGTGPAKVRHFQMYDGDREINSVSELLRCCLEDGEVDLRSLSVVSVPIDQTVLPANEGLSFFRY